MARKRWEDLSPAYRRRLERRGISRLQHAAGQILRGARGHGKTPERPGRLAYLQRVERAGQAIRLMRSQDIGEREAADRVGLSLRSLRQVFREQDSTIHGRLRRLDPSEASQVPFPVGGSYEPIWVGPARRVLGLSVGAAAEISRYFYDVKQAIHKRGDLRHWQGRVVLDLEGNVRPYVTDLDLLMRLRETDPEPWLTHHIGGS